MARTWTSDPKLSKIKLPSGLTYYLKDADARAILDAINDNVYESLKLALGTVDAGGNNLVTAANIKDYVDRIAEVGFDVVVLQTLPTADETAYNTYHNNIVLIQDSASKTGAYVEYVILKKAGETEGTFDYSWEKIGTTEVDLKGYLKDVTYDGTTHTLKQTKTNEQGGTTTTDVHTFGDLADADTASVDYTPAGTITVNPLTQTDTDAKLTKADYTPEGTINELTIIDSVGTAASKAADTFTQGTLPTKAKDTFDKGALPSFTEGAFDAGSLPSLGDQSTSTFAKDGITAAVDDDETLVFATAETANAVTDRGTFNAGALPSKAADTWDAGTLPSYTEGAFTQGTLPTFTEGEFTPNTVATTKKVTPVFTGTTTTDALVTGVKYDKATSAGATFTGTQAKIKVSPDAKE